MISTATNKAPKYPWETRPELKKSLAGIISKHGISDKKSIHGLSIGSRVITIESIWSVVNSESMQPVGARGMVAHIDSDHDLWVYIPGSKFLYCYARSMIKPA